VCLEVNLFRGYYDGFSAEISLPDGERSTWTLAPPPLDSLKSAAGPQEQGGQLFQWLFHGAEDAYRRGREWFDPPFLPEAGAPLRMRFRLGLDAQAAVLCQLPWETLYDAKRQEFLSLSLAFFRFLRVRVPKSWPVPERPLRLLAGAGPTGGVGAETAATAAVLQQAAGGGGKDLLQVQRVDEPLTLARPAAAQQPGYHVLHLRARAAAQGDREGLILTGDEGTEEFVSAARLAEAVAPKTGKPPALVFWAVLSSAGGPGAAVQASLAPALLEAGVQAVVTVPDGPTLEGFTRQFYEVLLQTGAIDVAVAVARSAIHVPGQWDWAYPVLYLRSAEAQLFQPFRVSF
jgi:hypothetical protein